MSGTADQKLTNFLHKVCEPKTFADFFYNMMIHFTKPQARLFSNISVSIIMTVVMTGGMLLVHSGYCVNFFKLWLNDFLVGCSIAVPTGLLIVPIVSQWVDLYTDNKNIS
jgi:Protein of unknown function (DUF2798)